MRPTLIAYSCSSIRKMIAELLSLEAEWRGVAGWDWFPTDRAPVAYERLRTSPEPLLAFLGFHLLGGTCFDLLRAAVEDPALQRHRYIVPDVMFELRFRSDEALAREWADTCRRLGVQHLPLPFTVDSLFATIDDPTRGRR